MTRKSSDDLHVRIRNLERINEALQRENAQLKDSAAPMDAYRFIEQRNQAREALKEARAEIQQLNKKLMDLRDRVARESKDDFDLRIALIAAERDRDLAKARALFLESQLSMEQMRKPISVLSTLFSHDIWRRLVQLCHPDKHNGSKASTEATKWLMEHRP